VADVVEAMSSYRPIGHRWAWTSPRQISRDTVSCMTPLWRTLVCACSQQGISSSKTENLGAGFIVSVLPHSAQMIPAQALDSHASSAEIGQQQDSATTAADSHIAHWFHGDSLVTWENLATM